jgi:P-type conjugative transfer protein TrbL
MIHVLRRLLVLFAVFGAAFVLTGGHAHAATPEDMFNSCMQPSGDNGMVNNGLATVLSGVDGIASRAAEVALKLFSWLIMIEVAWFIITLVARRSGDHDITSFFSDMGFQAITVLTMLAIISWAGQSQHIQGIFNAFAAAALKIVPPTVTGGGGSVTPVTSTLSDVATGSGGIMHLGACLAGYIMDGSTQHVLAMNLFQIDPFQIISLMVIALAALLIGLSYFFLGAQLFITIIESSFIGSAGVFMLGFMGSRWTMPFSQGYIKYIVSIGFKLFAIYIVAAFGVFLANNLMSYLHNALFVQGEISLQFKYALGLIGLAILLIMMAVRVPAMAATLITGTPDMALGHVASTAAGIGAGVAAVAAAGTALVAGGVGLLGGGAAAAGGGAAARGGTLSAANAATSSQPPPRPGGGKGPDAPRGAPPPSRASAPSSTATTRTAAPSTERASADSGGAVATAEAAETVATEVAAVAESAPAPASVRPEKPAPTPLQRITQVGRGLKGAYDRFPHTTSHASAPEIRISHHEP